MTVPILPGAVYLLDKGKDITSRRAAGRVARSNGYRKYGHAGTLDPDATGVLVVLLGRATRLSRFLTGHDKRYSFMLILGVTTDTDDDTGEVTGESDASRITADDVEAVLRSDFTGNLQQEVPLFSAVRVDGRRAFRAARSGDRTMVMPRKSVKVCDWETGVISDCRMELSVTVSAGTYIRGLARDIGQRLGAGGIAADIRRVRSGWFDVTDCSTGIECRESLLDMSSAMSGYPEIEIPDEALEGVLHGRPLESVAEGTVRLVHGDGRLVAVGEGEGGTVRPVCVLETAE